MWEEGTNIRQLAMASAASPTANHSHIFLSRYSQCHLAVWYDYEPSYGRLCTEDLVSNWWHY